MDENNIKELIKKHLNIDIKYQTPYTLSDGFVKVDLYWDDELIDESIEIIKKSFF